MADPIPFEAEAEALRIRARPRPVTRINRKLVVAGAGLLVLALFAAAGFALKPPQASPVAAPPETLVTGNKRQPEQLAALPASYSDLRPRAPQGGSSRATTIPALGPPLVGDLGATILAAEHGLGIDPAGDPYIGGDFRPNPELEAARARRMQEAALRDEAAAAPVFFTLASRQANAPGDRSAGTASADDPYTALKAELIALSGLSRSAPGMTGGAEDQNRHEQKQAFLSEAPESGIYNPHGLELPVSPYQVMAGTLIPASLLTGINSDLPGTIIAQVTQPVYDTVTGRHLLIPQGTRLLGRYQSLVSFGQNRALVAWDRMILPDGSSMIISLPGTDSQGMAGLSDRTDNHWDRTFLAAGLATILGIGTELGQDDDDEIARAIRQGAGQTVNEAGQRIVDRALAVQPTITVRPGWPVRVMVTRDLVLQPYGGTP